MPCYHPITGYRSKKGKRDGKWPIVFNPKEGFIDLKITVPCGKCIGCKLESSRQWAVRGVHELRYHTTNCYITLTYHPKHLPEDGSLNVVHFQLFMKRLRKKYQNKTIKYIHCGEYGEQLQRPHYHAIIFNHDFPDMKLAPNQKGQFLLYTSEELEELWPYGFNTIGQVTFESIAYVARYVTKKVSGPKKKDHYKNLKPEYITMSQGIGKKYFEEFENSIYVRDKIVIRNKFITKVPRYYDKLLEKSNPKRFLKIKKKRRIAAANKDPAENTYERLEVKEKVKLIKISTLKRKYEHNGNT